MLGKDMVMKICLWAACGLAALTVGGCATTSSIRMRDVVGIWYGSGIQPQNGPDPIHWMVERRADGSFLFKSFHERDCRIIPATIETGRWSMSNGIYTMITETVDGRSVDTADGYFQDVYLIESVSHAEVTVKSLTYGTRFVATRVGPDHLPVPGCGA